MVRCPRDSVYILGAKNMFDIDSAIEQWKRSFDSVDALQKQIARDVECARVKLREDTSGQGSGDRG